MSEVMPEAFTVGAFLLVVAVFLWMAGWLLRRRSRPSEASQQAALRLTPVSADTQHTIAELQRQGDQGRALIVLRRETRLPLSQLRQLTRLLSGHPHPRTYQETVAALHEQHPHLGAQLEQVVQQRSRVQAIRWLGQHFPLGLIAARDLVDAQRGQRQQDAH